MAILTVRNVPEEIHRALRLRAARAGRSTEAEVRAILEAAVKPERRVLMGDALAALGRRVGLRSEDIATIETAHRERPAEPMRFE